MLTLRQTGKIRSRPVVLVGTDYWRGLVDWLRDPVLREGKIDAADVDEIIVTDDLDEVVATLMRRRSVGLEEPVVARAAQREAVLAAVGGLDQEDRLVVVGAGRVDDLHELEGLDRLARVLGLEGAAGGLGDGVGLPAVVGGVGGGEVAVGALDLGRGRRLGGLARRRLTIAPPMAQQGEAR